MKISVFKTNQSLIIIFLMIFIGDTLTFLWFQKEFNFSLILKALVSIFLTINLYFNKRRYFYYFLLAIGLIGVGMLFNYKNDAMYKASQFFEYYSGVLFFCFLLVNSNRGILSKLLFYIFAFYCGTIVIGTLLDLDFLRTYSEIPKRFGFKSLFSSQNEFSFILIATLIFFYNRLLTHRNALNIAWFTLALTASVCSGTKVVYLFVFCFIIFLIYKHLGKVILLVTALGIGGIVYWTQGFWTTLFKSQFKVLYDVYEDKGWIDMLSSLRIEYLGKRLVCQSDNFNGINYFFGGLIEDCRTEMSVFDLFLFFGVIGLLLYFFIFKKVVLDYLKLNFSSVFFLSIVTLLSFIAGYYFENFSAQIYMLSVFYVYYLKPQNDLPSPNKTTV